MENQVKETKKLIIELSNRILIVSNNFKTLTLTDRSILLDVSRNIIETEQKCIELQRGNM